MKIYYKDEDLLGNAFCDSKKCDLHNQTEPESYEPKCYGCDEFEKFMENNDELIVSESSVDEFISRKEILEQLDNVLSYPLDSRGIVLEKVVEAIKKGEYTQLSKNKREK